MKYLWKTQKPGERRTRLYAYHMGLMVRERDGAFTLVDRYDRKRTLGRYRSVATLYRAIHRYHLRELRELMALRIPIALIKPLPCNRPETVPHYAAMLRERRKAPPIMVIKQRRGSRYPFRLFDGAHRLRAAKLIGRKTIMANVVASD